MDCRFPKEERLRSKSDIDRVFRSPCHVRCFGAKLVYSKNGLGHSRVLFTLVRKYGNSVQRNRAKRVSKEIYRQIKSDLVPGYDMVIILYPGKDDYEERRKQFLQLFRKAEILVSVSPDD